MSNDWSDLVYKPMPMSLWAWVYEPMSAHESMRCSFCKSTLLSIQPVETWDARFKHNLLLSNDQGPTEWRSPKSRLFEDLAAPPTNFVIIMSIDLKAQQSGDPQKVDYLRTSPPNNFAISPWGLSERFRHESKRIPYNWSSMSMPFTSQGLKN